MKLNRKTFIYSMILAAIIVALFLGYMLLMLPSLYVVQRERNNITDTLEIHKNYIKNGEYGEDINFNFTNSISLNIPKNGNTVKMSNYFFNSDIEIIDGKYTEGLEQVRKFTTEEKNYDKVTKKLVEDKFEEYFPEELFDFLKESSDKYFKINAKNTDFTEEYTNFIGSNGEFKNIDKDTILMITKSENLGNSYSNNFFFTNKDGEIYLTFFSVVTPLITDIKEPIYTSIPMIVLTIIILSILVSKYFSSKIVNPIIKISKHADSSKSLPLSDIKPIEINTGDEIEQLSLRLNDLYENLKDGYEKLEDESKRREVFLRASSHQLRTPISAALLLVNGMIDKIGKYENRDHYLPELKKQILEMNKLVTDILSLSHIAENIEFNTVNMKDLLNNIILNYKFIIEEKKIGINIFQEDFYINTDYEIIFKILDNLINNAIRYSKEESNIIIEVDNKKLEILNTKSSIPTEVEDNIFEPFVSTSEEKGHGLGLYIVEYYVKLLEYKVDVRNIETGVLSTIYFK